MEPSGAGVLMEVVSSGMERIPIKTSQPRWVQILGKLSLPEGKIGGDGKGTLVL
jgi:hypothetical protein